MADARELSQLLSRQAESVCRYLLPNGQKIGQEWRCGSIQGEPGQSLGVHLSGPKTGVWMDFATSEKGDLLELWKLVRNIGFSETLNEINQWLGIAKPQFYKTAVDKPYTKPGVQAISQPPSPGVTQYLTQKRLLSAETWKAFKVGSKGEDIAMPFHSVSGELVMVKYLSLYRPEGKKQIHTTKDPQPILFGWQAMSPEARAVTICEGEIDAMSLHQYGYDALSVPFGAGSGNKLTWIESEYDNLERFDTIFLAFDNDEPGKRTALEVAKRLGTHRCQLVELPEKDANECLKKQLGKEAIDSCFQLARSFDPAELKRASEYVDSVIQEFYPVEGQQTGLLLPWSSSHTNLAIRPSELSVWVGFNGSGKSQMIGHTILDLMKQGERVCIASMEIKPALLLARLVKQATILKLPPQDHIRAVHEWLDDKLWLFDVVGTAKAERILEVFKYARKRYGVTQFVIDSLMKCGIAEDDYRGQKEFIDQLCDFKNEFDCHVHLVAHSRKGESENHAPGKMDVKGSGSITDLTDNVFSVWRNKQREEALDAEPNNLEHRKKPAALLTCLKQRNGDWEGKLPLWFDKESYQFLDSYDAKPIPYVGPANLQANQ